MLYIVDVEKEKKYRHREFNKTDKDFFMQFQIHREDVSSGTGEVEGWLSSDATPVKGIIKDVIFFGDLWGDLIKKQVTRSGRRVKIPDTVKNML